MAIVGKHFRGGKNVDGLIALLETIFGDFIYKFLDFNDIGLVVEHQKISCNFFPSGFRPCVFH